MSSNRSKHPIHRVAFACVLSTLAGLVAPNAARGDALDDALKLVPDDAVAWMVGPSLSRLNADLGDLIDRADRPELAVAGRPVDVLVSQFGMAVGFDERGSLATWSPTIEDLLDGQGVVAVPVEDAARFLSGNFSEDPDGGEGAVLTRDGRRLFARTIEGHVLLAPRAELVGDWTPGAGRSRVLGVHGEGIEREIDEADLLLRITGDAVDAAQRLASTDRPELPLDRSPIDPERFRSALESRFGGAEDILVAVNADALALGVRGWTVFAEDSETTRLSRTVEPEDLSVFAPLPAGPFYMAMGLDFDRFGGAAAVRLFESLAAELELPFGPAMTTLGDSLRGFAFVARPSKLGLAMGGMLNDAALVLVGRDGAARIRDSVETIVGSMNGVSGALERETTFERSVEQRKGGVADEIAMKVDIAPSGRREEGARVGDASIQLTGERMLYGPRGLSGLGRSVDGDYVVTFSRRPDVMARAVSAVGGTDSLAEEPMIASISAWLPARPGFLAMFDVGRLAGLARQVASIVPDAANSIPTLPESMPPIAVATTLVRNGDRGRIDWGVVVPAEVIGASVGAAIAEFARPGGAAE